MMASIISINISSRKGEKKTPVESAELKTEHGIIGDAHAGMRKRQVSLLAKESIQRMKDMGVDVGSGDFAENITTEGIDLPELPLGTRLELGPALVEVTQIGKKCHDRCNIYQQVGDCVMPREGIFVRVLEGGKIKEGDPLTVVGEQ
ncbi:MAG: MOSC domain-containing protein [Actinomycetota bacterium]